MCVRGGCGCVLGVFCGCKMGGLVGKEWCVCEEDCIKNKKITTRLKIIVTLIYGLLQKDGIKRYRYSAGLI